MQWLTGEEYLNLLTDAAYLRRDVDETVGDLLEAWVEGDHSAYGPFRDRCEELGLDELRADFTEFAQKVRQRQ